MLYLAKNHWSVNFLLVNWSVNCFVGKSNVHPKICQEKKGSILHASEKMFDKKANFWPLNDGMEK